MCASDRNRTCKGPSVHKAMPNGIPCASTHSATLAMVGSPTLAAGCPELWEQWDLNPRHPLDLDALQQRFRWIYALLPGMLQIAAKIYAFRPACELALGSWAHPTRWPHRTESRRGGSRTLGPLLVRQVL